MELTEFYKNETGEDATWRNKEGSRYKARYVLWLEAKVIHFSNKVANKKLKIGAFHCKNCGFDDGSPELQCPVCNDVVTHDLT